MRPKNYKGGRCTKRKFKKCDEIVKTYDKVQTAYAEVLNKDKNITSFQCNVPLNDTEYTTDFVCINADGDIMVRECVYRKQLSLPRTCKLLDISKEYWHKRGVKDWAIVIEEVNNED